MATSETRLQYLLSKSTDREADKKIIQPHLHIAMGVPGTMLEMLIKVINFWLKLSDADLQDKLEFIHVFIDSILTLDDIQDNSSLRRGFPAAHLIYGIQRTVAANHFAMSMAIDKINDWGKPEALRKLVDGEMGSHRGQTVEIYWRDNYICPTEEDYIEMVTLKTGAFLGVVLDVMQLFSDNKTDYSKIVELLGVYIQIHDDYGNLRFQQYKDRKGYCEDLTEGKFSFPIVHAINSHPEDQRVLNIVKQRTKDNEVKKTCVQILEEFGSFAYTEQVLKDMEDKIRAESNRVGGNPVLEAFFYEAKIVNEAVNKLDMSL